VKLFATGNAANGNGQNNGDRIYSTSIELTPAVVPSKPSIAAEQG